MRHIVESVLSTYLGSESGLAGVNVYTGDSDDINVLPKAITICDSARAPAGLPEGLGNYSCSVRITLFSNADDTTLAQHRARCAGLVGAMQNVTAIKLGFVADGEATCYDVSPLSEDEGVNERSWATVFSYDLWAVMLPSP